MIESAVKPAQEKVIQAVVRLFRRKLLEYPHALLWVLALHVKRLQGGSVRGIVGVKRGRLAKKLGRFSSLLVRAVNLPVVAAGGIMDGAGIAAVLSLGAQAAQIGTAFIPCPESGATETYRAALLAATEDDTTLTDRFSGKPARGLRNRFIRESARADFPKLPFPAQSQLTSKLRTAAAQAGAPDFLALWAGQAVPLARRMPAAELLQTLERETFEAIERVASLRHAVSKATT
jgi:nitronate monooxygenase